VLLFFGPAGVEWFFREVATPARSFSFPPADEPIPNRETLVAMMSRYGQTVLGPPPPTEGLSLRQAALAAPSKGPRRDGRMSLIWTLAASMPSTALGNARGWIQTDPGVLKTPGLPGLWSDLASRRQSGTERGLPWRIVAAATEPPQVALSSSRRQSGNRARRWSMCQNC
jgi:hypothetical protein